MSFMWCIVILFMSLTLTSQSPPSHSLKFDRRHNLKDVQNFKIDEEEQELADNSKNTPLNLERKTTKPTTPPMSPKQRYHQDKLISSFGEKYNTSPLYRRILQRCSEDKRHIGRIINLNMDPFIWPQRELCRGQTYLLIAVHTRPTNFDKRKLIRETYGSIQNVHGKRVVVAFFIGNSGNPQTQKKLEQEVREYGDIVKRDFKEHYRNMTIKHQTVLEWVMDYCSNVKYLVKVDDDVFVNVFQVLTYVETFQPPGFYCSRSQKSKTLRSGKWKLTFKEYPRKTFPPYCMGYGYVMRASHAKSIYWCSVYSKFLWIDDVLITGLIPEKLRINVEGYQKGYRSSYVVPSHASEKIVDYVFLLGIQNTVIPSLFRRLWRASLQYSY